MLNSECERIMNDSGCDWLDELVTAVFLSHTKILTAVKKANKKQKKINLKIPKIDHFIHKCYIECAREFWRNPYLFSRRCTQSEFQRNGRESQRIICTTIEETIRKLLPVKNILKEYLGEDEGSDTDTSFIDSGYRSNLRKMVKKEIEICQGKNDEIEEVPGETEEEEGLEKQNDIEEIQDVISNKLYVKDLTRTDSNAHEEEVLDDSNSVSNVIDLDDIEEISLLESNVKNNEQTNVEPQEERSNPLVEEVLLETPSVLADTPAVEEEVAETPAEEEVAETPAVETPTDEASQTPAVEALAETPTDEALAETPAVEEKLLKHLLMMH